MNPIIALKTLKLLRDPLTFEEKTDETIKLTAREVEVFEQLSKGLNHITIANNIFFSPYTVKRTIKKNLTKKHYFIITQTICFYQPKSFFTNESFEEQSFIATRTFQVKHHLFVDL